ncbi:MAG: hypothetical protein ABW321_13835 [Polyangiales bacterium]
MIRDERGIAYVETLVAMPVMFFAFNIIFLFGYLCAAQLIVQRAASAAARAAVVFLPDDPEYYNRPDTQSNSGKRSATKEACVKMAAMRVLEASPGFMTTNANDVTVDVAGDKKEFATTTVTVTAKYSCSRFLGASLCRVIGSGGSANFVQLSSKSALPYQEGMVEKSSTQPLVPPTPPP